MPNTTTNNTRYITVVTVPGPGAASVEVSSTATVADLVQMQNAFDRTAIVDGEAIPREQWGDVALGDAQEVFLTGTVKGNM